MTFSISTAFRQINSTLGVCPCCGDIFRLADAHPYLKGKRVATPLDKIDAAERRIERAAERLDEVEFELREEAWRRGQIAAKRRLRKIDPTFSGRGIDPQDVKVIFNPVQYVVFAGLNGDGVSRIELVAQEPNSAATEKVHRSIEASIDSRCVFFEVMRAHEDGSIVIEHK